MLLNALNGEAAPMTYCLPLCSAIVWPCPRPSPSSCRETWLRTANRVWAKNYMSKGGPRRKIIEVCLLHPFVPKQPLPPSLSGCFNFLIKPCPPLLLRLVRGKNMASGAAIWLRQLPLSAKTGGPGMPPLIWRRGTLRDLCATQLCFCHLSSVAKSLYIDFATYNENFYKSMSAECIRRPQIRFSPRQAL